MHVFGGGEAAGGLVALRGRQVVVDVAPVRHERRHVKVLGERDERRDLLVQTVGMFETLQRRNQPNKAKKKRTRDNRPNLDYLTDYKTQ